MRRKKGKRGGKVGGRLLGAVAVGIGAGRRDMTGYIVDRCLAVVVLCLAVRVQDQGSHRGGNGRGGGDLGDLETGRQEWGSWCCCFWC